MAPQYCIIRNPKSGLVLDASEYKVKIQHFTGYPAQFWKLQPTGQGKYFIVNKGNCEVMDIECGIKSGANIITYPKKEDSNENQQWFINSDNTIVSASGNLAVDIWKRKYTPGTKIIAYPKRWIKINSQKFILQFR